MRRRLSEYFAVCEKGAEILNRIMRVFIAPCAWIVIDLLAENSSAHLISVALGILQMQMPDLVYQLGWSHLIRRCRGENHKTLILRNHTLSELRAPSLLLREPLRKRSLGTWSIKSKSFHPLNERIDRHFIRVS